MIVAVLVEPYTYTVYAIDSLELGYAEDVLADVAIFDIIYDPFRTEDLIVIDLSKLPG